MYNSCHNERAQPKRRSIQRARVVYGVHRTDHDRERSGKPLVANVKSYTPLGPCTTPATTDVPTPNVRRSIQKGRAVHRKSRENAGGGAIAYEEETVTEELTGAVRPLLPTSSLPMGRG